MNDKNKKREEKQMQLKRETKHTYSSETKSWFPRKRKPNKMVKSLTKATYVKNYYE